MFAHRSIGGKVGGKAPKTVPSTGIRQARSGIRQARSSVQSPPDRRLGDRKDQYLKAVRAPGLLQPVQVNCILSATLGGGGGGGGGRVKEKDGRSLCAFFDCTCTQLGVDFSFKVLQYDDNTSVRLQIWDIQG